METKFAQELEAEQWTPDYDNYAGPSKMELERTERMDQVMLSIADIVNESGASSMQVKSVTIRNSAKGIFAEVTTKRSVFFRKV